MKPRRIPLLVQIVTGNIDLSSVFGIWLYQLLLYVFWAAENWCCMWMLSWVSVKSNWFIMVLFMDELHLNYSKWKFISCIKHGIYQIDTLFLHCTHTVHIFPYSYCSIDFPHTSRYHHLRLIDSSQYSTFKNFTCRKVSWSLMLEVLFSRKLFLRIAWWRWTVKIGLRCGGN